MSFMYSVNNLFPASFSTTGNYLLCLKSFYSFGTKIVHNMFVQKRISILMVLEQITSIFHAFSLLWICIMSQKKVSLRSGLIHFCCIYFVLYSTFCLPLSFLIVLFKFFSKALHAVETHLRNLGFQNVFSFLFQTSFISMC